jgi:hypothetical protein
MTCCHVASPLSEVGSPGAVGTAKSPTRTGGSPTYTDAHVRRVQMELRCAEVEIGVVSASPQDSTLRYLQRNRFFRTGEGLLFACQGHKRCI